MRLGRFILLALILGAGLAQSSAHAQQPAKVARIGLLSLAAGPASFHEAFRQGLREAGYVEGKNVIIEYRWAAGTPERLAGLAAELVQRKVDVIVTETTPAALAAKQGTATIPIVMATGGDAVGSGIVASLARPGGNVTGNSFMLTELSAKYVQLLKKGPSGALARSRGAATYGPSTPRTSLRAPPCIWTFLSSLRGSGLFSNLLNSASPAGAGQDRNRWLGPRGGRGSACHHSISMSPAPRN